MSLASTTSSSRSSSTWTWSRSGFAGQNRADRLTAKRGRASSSPITARTPPATTSATGLESLPAPRTACCCGCSTKSRTCRSTSSWTPASRCASRRSRHAQRVAAALCYIGLAHLDQLTILPFGARHRRRSRRPAAARAGSSVSSTAREMEPVGPTNLRAVVQGLASRPRSSGSVIISDFLDPGGFDAASSCCGRWPRRLRRAHRVRARSRPGRARRGAFVDSRTGELREIDVTPQLAPAYGKAWRAHAEELERFCGRYTWLRPRRRGAAVRGHHPEDLPPGPIPRMTFRRRWPVWLAGSFCGRGRARRRLFLVKLRPPRVSFPLCSCGGAP